MNKHLSSEIQLSSSTCFFRYQKDETPDLSAKEVNDQTTFISPTKKEAMRMGTKDQTQYKFNNGILAKGRLVLEIVKQYVKDNPKITYQELKNIFPDNLQANS